ncbi:MAG TPA: class I SAM-dependent methyltransferase [Roseovarius sp.]
MDFKRPEDVRYVPFLKRLHARLLFDWYMEIGCRTGRSFADVRGKTIAVDPYFRIKSNVIGVKPALHIFQQTSDDFFASGVLSALNVRLGFSFLDGMHLVEYLLRDFMHTEKHCHPDGVIALHDCCPYSFEMTTRDVDDAPKDAWTGDVWKLIPILQNYRPDLKLTVIGCRPTGLVLVSGLDPDNRTLDANYDAITREWADVSLENFGAGRFYGLFDYTPCAQIEAGDYALFDGVRKTDELQDVPLFVSP